MPKYRRGFLIGLITAVTGIVVAFSSIQVRKLEHGWLLKIRGVVEAPSEVVIVANNKDAAEKLNQSREFIKWSRHLHADLIKEMVRRGASVIAFDIMFVESGKPDEDTAFATAIRNSARVVLSERIQEEDRGLGIKKFYIEHPVEEISDAARGLGPFPVPDEGRVSQFWTFENKVGDLPTLPVVTLQLYALQVFDDFQALLIQAGLMVDDLPANSEEIKNAEDLRQYMGLLRGKLKENPQLKERLLSLLAVEDDRRINGPEHRLLLALVNLYGGEKSYYYNLYGPLGTIKTIPYDEILLPGNKGKPAGNAFDLTGKIVFVGDSEWSGPVQEDEHETVFTENGVDLTGVELAATVFSNLLTGSMLQRNIPASFVALLFFGLLAGGLATLAPGMRAITVTVVLTAAYFTLAVYLFTVHTLWISLSTQVLFQAPAGLFIGLFCQYWCARKEQERLVRWVPHRIKDVPETGLVFGTCLFTDIRGSRNLSGQLGVREYKSFMEKYYETIKQPVIRNGGRIIDFYGDGMMCLFAAKKTHTGLRLRASMTAIEILLQAELFNRQQPEENRLKIGVGLHSGLIDLGEGAQLGDVGNTVYSIEQLNKQLSTRILSSKEVFDGFRESLSGTCFAADKRGSFFARRIGSFLLPGKTEPTSIFELMESRESLAEEIQTGVDISKLLELSATALSEFEKQNWKKAAKAYEQILSYRPGDGPARFFLKKCREYCQKPPLPGENSVLKIVSKEQSDNFPA